MRRPWADTATASPGNKNPFGDRGAGRRARARASTTSSACPARHVRRERLRLALGGGIFSDIGYGMSSIVPLMGTVLGRGRRRAPAASCRKLRVGVRGGDDYPMAETLIIDGIGTCSARLRLVLRHDSRTSAPRPQGARRAAGYSPSTACCTLSCSGAASSRRSTSQSGCASSALLIFAGSLICRQAIEDNPPATTRRSSSASSVPLQLGSATRPAGGP